MSTFDSSPTRPATDGPETGSGFDRTAFSRQREQLGRQMIHNAAECVKAHIRRQPPVQRFFSFMPTLLTRVSPFHFWPRGKAEAWPLVRLDSGEGSSWGRMVVVGELLVVFDETVLFALLMLMVSCQQEAFETDLDEICRMAYIKDTPVRKAAVWQSLQRLAGTRIDLTLSSGKGRKKRILKRMTGSILSFADMDQDSGPVHIMVNPYFIELYADSFVTNIDMTFRAGLKSDVSKALYRFYQGLYEKESTVSLSALARAVNLWQPNQPASRLRAKVRRGLSELAEAGYLVSYRLPKDGQVTAIKSEQVALNMQAHMMTPGLKHLAEGGSD